MHFFVVPLKEKNQLQEYLNRLSMSRGEDNFR
jgi:hypothetical protein